VVIRVVLFVAGKVFRCDRNRSTLRTVIRFSIPAAWFIRSGRGIKPGIRESQSAQTGIAPSALFCFFTSSFAGHDKTL
jgi:hypothetical protein